MKALLIAVGSRGDAEPFVALADALAKEGHTVDLCLQPEVTPSYDTSPLIRKHALPFTQMDFYKYAGNPSASGANHESPRVRFVGIVADIIANLVLPCYQHIQEDVIGNQTVDWIVVSSLARPLGIALAQKHSIKLAICHLQALIPTAVFPPYSATEDCLKAIENTDKLTLNEEYRDIYWELERHQHDFLHEALDRLYRDHLQLESSISFEDLQEILLGKHNKTWIINAFSNQLLPSVIPRDSGLGPNVLESGPLAADYLPPGFSPPPALEAFLAKDSPVAIGFGSMPYSGVATILDALYENETRAILIGDALNIPETEEDSPEKKAWMEESVFHISSIPYPWLLPQCRAMMSHGGAGVLHATLRAGIPPLIAPFMGDQFFWAKLVQQLGVGHECTSHLASMTKEDVIGALATITDCQDAARHMGAAMQAHGSGVARVVHLMATQAPAAGAGEE